MSDIDTGKKRRRDSTSEYLGRSREHPGASVPGHRAVGESASEALEEESKMMRVSQSDQAFAGDGESSDADEDLTKASMMVCMTPIQERARDIHLKWLETFGESECFESMAVVRVEALLKKAIELKQNLQDQKQLLIDRVKSVTSILEQPL